MQQNINMMHGPMNIKFKFKFHPFASLTFKYISHNTGFVSNWICCTM